MISEPFPHPNVWCRLYVFAYPGFSVSNIPSSIIVGVTSYPNLYVASITGIVDIEATLCLINTSTIYSLHFSYVISSFVNFCIYSAAYLQRNGIFVSM